MRLWSKREAQIKRVTAGMIGMIGDLQGIAQDSLPHLDEIELLALPEGKEGD